MGEKEPQATSSRGVFEEFSIFFLRRVSGNLYSSILLASPVIACKTVERLCEGKNRTLLKGRSKEEEYKGMTEGVVDLSEDKVLVLKVDESDSGAVEPPKEQVLVTKEREAKGLRSEQAVIEQDGWRRW